MDFGLYVHIPFCRQKCFYCDFPSWAGRERFFDAYIQALGKEIAHRGGIMAGNRAATVYFGGGTPTVLPQEQLLFIIEEIKKHFQMADDAEFTVEANPGTVNQAYLAALHQAGINRLSLGVQSFDDGLLKQIGRIHSSQQAMQTVGWAQRAGFANISIDLMYGLPGQTMEQWQDSINQAAALGIQHISMYGLQVEEGTVFGRWQEQGKLTLPDEDTTEAMYNCMVKTAPELGFARYEVSSFARPGFESRHNCGYWQDKPYLGLGAAAHSYLWQDNIRNASANHAPAEAQHLSNEWCRSFNHRDISGYIEVVNRGDNPSRLEEIVSAKSHMEEYCFLGLRMCQGISRKKFQAAFGCSLDSVYGQQIIKLSRQGLLADDGQGIYLTEAGFFYGNQVFLEFLLE